MDEKVTKALELTNRVVAELNLSDDCYGPQRAALFEQFMYWLNNQPIEGEPTDAQNQ